MRGGTFFRLPDVVLQEVAWSFVNLPGHSTLLKMLAADLRSCPGPYVYIYIYIYTFFPRKGPQTCPRLALSLSLSLSAALYIFVLLDTMHDGFDVSCTSEFCTSDSDENMYIRILYIMIRI